MDIRYTVQCSNVYMCGVALRQLQGIKLVWPWPWLDRWWQVSSFSNVLSSWIYLSEFLYCHSPYIGCRYSWTNPIHLLKICWTGTHSSWPIAWSHISAQIRIHLLYGPSHAPILTMYFLITSWICETEELLTLISRWHLYLALHIPIATYIARIMCCCIFAP